MPVSKATRFPPADTSPPISRAQYRERISAVAAAAPAIARPANAVQISRNAARAVSGHARFVPLVAALGALACSGTQRWPADDPPLHPGTTIEDVWSSAPEPDAVPHGIPTAPKLVYY